MQHVPAWFWPAAGWLTLAAAAWLFVGPWLRRHPGRACPCCRYDMTGVPSLTCPECGRTAKRERRLYRRPPARLRRLAAFACAAAAWVIAHLPAALERGPVALTPGWVLSRCSPATGTAYDKLLVRGEPPEIAAVAGEAPVSLNERVGSALYVETWRRLRDGELSAADARRYLKRALNTDVADYAGVRVPGAWPSDRPFSLSGSVDWTETGRLPTRYSEFITGWSAKYSPGQPVTVTLDIRVDKCTYAVPMKCSPVDLSTKSDRFMSPQSSPAIDAAVAAFYVFRIHVNRSHASPGITRVWQSRHATNIPYYGYFRATVMLDGECIGAGEGGWAGIQDLPFAVTWVEGGERRAASDPDRVVLRLQGDEKLAYFSYIQDWSHPREAWSGTAELKSAFERGDR